MAFNKNLIIQTKTLYNDLEALPVSKLYYKTITIFPTKKKHNLLNSISDGAKNNYLVNRLKKTKLGRQFQIIGTRLFNKIPTDIV